MNDTKPQRTRLLELADLYCVANLSDAEFVELERVLDGNSEACADFGHYVQLHANLEEHLRGELAGRAFFAALEANGSQPQDHERGLPGVARRIVRYFSSPKPLSIAVAAIVIGLLITAMAFMAAPIYRHWTKPHIPRDGSAPLQFVARLTDGHQAEWAAGQIGVSPGARLVAGHELILEKGLVEITFKDGAVAILEGPAQFAVLGPGRGHLYSGRVTARVPAPATGFSIKTADVRIVDLGTEFGVDAGRGATRVHVFSGRVKLIAMQDGRAVEHAGANDTVESGASVTVRGGKIHANNADSLAAAAFVRQLPIPADQPELGNTYREAVLQSKPLGYWRFAKTQGKQFLDEGGSKRALVLFGEPALAAPHKGISAIRLDGSSHLSMLSPDELEGSPYSVELWVWPAKVEHQTIVSAEVSPSVVGRPTRSSFCLELDATFRQANPPGTLRAVHRHQPAGMGGEEAFAPQVCPTGRWAHVVMVHDGDELKLFVDGRQVVAQTSDNVLSHAPTYINFGAMGDGRRGPVQRHFHGYLADSAVYARALSNEEIRSHYEAAFPDGQSKAKGK